MIGHVLLLAITAFAIIEYPRTLSSSVNFLHHLI